MLALKFEIHFSVCFSFDLRLFIMKALQLLKKTTTFFFFYCFVDALLERWGNCSKVERRVRCMA